jgi:hypothetical protein
VAHVYNPGYSGGRDQDDKGSKPAQTNSSSDAISKYPMQTRTGGGAQVVKHLPSNPEALVQTPVPPKKKKKKVLELKGHDFWSEDMNKEHFRHSCGCGRNSCKAKRKVENSGCALCSGPLNFLLMPTMIWMLSIPSQNPMY